jgi:hypothetical protein
MRQVVPGTEASPSMVSLAMENGDRVHSGGVPGR